MDYSIRFAGYDDVVEVAPPFDVGGVTALAGATIAFELLCVIARNVESGVAALGEAPINAEGRLALTELALRAAWRAR